MTAASTTTLAATSVTAQQGLPVRLAAAVTGTASGAVPTGSVTFATGSTTLGSSTLDPTGTAEFITTMLPLGSSTVTAAYGGDSHYSGSTSAGSALTITSAGAKTYSNPLALAVTSTQAAVSCADPAIYKLQSAAGNTWYLYCTSDALYSGDTAQHFINVFSSTDLVNWTYVGNAFAGLPSWANVTGAMMWAPAIEFMNGEYYLYYAVSASALAGNGSAIGVGTSSSPAGPFVDHGTAVVEPELATLCCAGSYRATIDPDITEDSSGQRYILFGSFEGGIFVRKLSADGFTSDASSETEIAADNRYEGGNWWVHGGYFYLLASSTNCCNGPLTGYGVFAGRATTPMGPYVDAAGVSLSAVDTGGTPVLAMNGNRVVGPGGNVVFTDATGQDYILYHGVLAGSPYYAGDVGYTARPAFLDALDWVNGWPVARGGYGPSDADAPQPMPAAQAGETGGYQTALAIDAAPQTAVSAFSDDFTDTKLAAQWSSIHSAPGITLTGNGLEMPTAAFDTTNAMASVPLLAENAPPGDFMVETELDLNLPLSGAGADYAQAGLLLYADDADYLRLDLYANSDTRQIEFVKAQAAAGVGYPTWGATDVGSPALTSTVTAWLRIARLSVNGEQHYTAWSSSDGMRWIRGGTWVAALGSNTRVCLYGGNRSGFTATFHYVHVSTVQ
ncbi:MAG TPA: family 43 glycosylhydrolase [Acidobacteriaceae bacterium]